MQLEKIKIEKCPTCGADAISEEKIKFDPTSKNFSEKRIFPCGLQLYSDEGSKEIIIGRFCKCSNEYIIQSTKRKEALSGLLTYIESLDVDGIFKIKLFKSLTGIDLT